MVEAKGVQTRNDSGRVDEIVAAGALQSPQVLETSGIGSKEILQRHGIQVAVDNPGVGENFQDHCFTSVSFEVADGQSSRDIVRDPVVIDTLVEQCQDTQNGPLSGVPFSLAYVPPVDKKGRMAAAEVLKLTEAYVRPSNSELDPGTKTQQAELTSMILDPRESTCFYALAPGQMHINAEGKTSMSEAYAPRLPQNYISIMIGLNHPMSRGSVHIGSSEPTASPIIDPRYLSHPLDTEILARATHFTENIVQAPALKCLLKNRSRVPVDACLTDLESAKKITKDRLWSTYHVSCSCAMMPRELGGVVSDRLIVHGTKNLRVIDASVFPMITMGNIQATVYAVAERASDLIKEDWARAKVTT